MAVAAAVAVAAVADVADVAAVAMSMTNMPIAHYHTGNISRKMHFFFGHAPLKIRHIVMIFSKNSLPMAFPASGTYLASSAAKFYS